MSKKTYELTGRPVPGSPDAALVEGHAVGETFEADLTKAEETGLVNAGAVRVVESSSRSESGGKK